MIEGVHWRFVAIVAVLAAIVSVVSGGLGGVRSGVILLRAGIGGVVFAALGLLLDIVFQNFFPEVFSMFIRNNDESASHHVDVFVGDDEENEESYEDKEDDESFSGQSENPGKLDMEYDNRTERRPNGSFQTDHDPAEVAKAVRTMMKEDLST